MVTARRLAFVADFGTQNFHLKNKFDMEHNTSINHKNGNDANRLLAVRAYKCTHCGKIVNRESNKKWIKSYCDETGKDVRLVLVKA